MPATAKKTPETETDTVAKAPKASTLTKAPKASTYETGTFSKIPAYMLTKKRRTNWGWEALSKPKAYVIVPGQEVEAARASAHSYAKSHGFEVATVPFRDPEGNVPMIEAKDADGNPIPAKNRSGLTGENRMIPEKFWFVRTT